MVFAGSGETHNRAEAGDWWSITETEGLSPLCLRRQHRTKNLWRKPPELRNWERRDLKLLLRNATHSWGKRYEVKLVHYFGFRSSWGSRLIFVCLVWQTGCSAGQSPFRERLKERTEGADDRWERQTRCSYRLIEKVGWFSFPAICHFWVHQYSDDALTVSVCFH